MLCRATRLSGQSSRALGAPASSPATGSTTAGSSSRSSAIKASASSATRAAFGHHHRDRLADVGDLVLRQHIRIDMEADRAGRQRLRDAVARSAAAGDRRTSAPRARREGPWPRSRRCRSIGRAPPGCAGTPHAARRGYPGRRRSGPGRATADRPRRASCGGRTTMLVPPSPWSRCRNYDALRMAAPPPRKPSRIATARFMENSRVF